MAYALQYRMSCNLQINSLAVSGKGRFKVLNFTGRMSSHTPQRLSGLQARGIVFEMLQRLGVVTNVSPTTAIYVG